MNLGQLRTNCLAEIERGWPHTTLRKIKVLDYKLLAWYRIRDARPHYVDNALCWAKTTTDHGPMWALVHMARNPRSADTSWGLYEVTDTPNAWLLFFAGPPKSNDIDTRMTFFKFRAETPWDMYDSQLLTNNWEAAVGEKPARTFSNQPGQRTEPSRSGQQTNRTSSRR